jgi:ADP-heptose:LPS heptosyltransferase
VGVGDKLMAIGDAWTAFQLDPSRKVGIGDGGAIDMIDYDLCWGLDHFLATPADIGANPLQWVISTPGNRPYIDYDAMRKELFDRDGDRISKRRKLVSRLGHYIHRANYRAKPAPLVLKPEEEAFAAQLAQRGPFVLIEPNIKPSAPPSKVWPARYYGMVAQELDRDVPVYQLTGTDQPVLPGLKTIKAPSFRMALAALKASTLYIGPEGGLHHGAAAVDTKAVVIFGGFISPDVTGYRSHINLTGGVTYACGTRHGGCKHCEQAMANISPADVVDAARKLLA